MNLSRRSFLGAFATLSAAAAGVSCASPNGDDDEAMLGVSNRLAATTSLVLDLKVDCGAKGDGITNDTAAFQDAAKRIWAAGGGELTIPAGTYIVGRQTKKTSSSAPGPYY